MMDNYLIPLIYLWSCILATENLVLIMSPAAAMDVQGEKFLLFSCFI